MANRLRPDIPVSNEALNEYSRKFYLDAAEKMNAERIWIAILGRDVIFTDDRSDFLIKLKSNIDYFRKSGVEVGVWTSTLGYGGPLSGSADVTKTGSYDFARIVPVVGGEFSGDAFCPSDERFTTLIANYMEDIAELHPDLIMLDDELCLSVRPGIGCFCKNHMNRLSKKVGSKVDIKDLPSKIFSGAPSAIRDTWYQVVGDTLRDFCREIRKAVDKADTGIRLGMCAGYTSWDIEGVSVIELSRILAGQTKPFFRLTSAPYWVSALNKRFPGQGLNSVIECARLQHYWCKDDTDIEIFAENDTYPRPAYHSSSALCEQFDFAMQASGIRSLKYVMDYVSSPEYEQGYIRSHMRNLPLYEKINDAFSDKIPAGVRLFRKPQTIRESVLPDYFAGQNNVMRTFFSQAAALLSGLGIPVCYEGNCECGAAFGEDVYAFGEKIPCKKMILDLSGAVILSNNGTDVGLKTFSPVYSAPHKELFGKEQILLSGVGKNAVFPKEPKLYNISLKDGAAVKSTLLCKEGEYIGSYTYFNGETEFLVFNFNALSVGEDSSLFLSYSRQDQINDFIGNVYPSIRRHPGIYSICARSQDAERISVLFENIGSDIAFDFSIKLGRECESFNLTGIEGTLESDGKGIKIHGDFYPATAILLEIKYI